jgi:biotin transport system substrate-specific component
VSTIALTLAPPRSRTTARLAFQVACAVGGSLLMAGLAQVVVHLPFTPVPITGQTLGVLLIGAAYGPALGAATILLYLAWAIVGLPVFAPNADGSHETGLQVLAFAGTTGGYLWGFVLASALVGWLSRQGWDRSIRSSISAMLLGSIVIYAVGLPWLHHALPAVLGEPVSWQTTFELGLYPFLIGDTVKLLLAAGLLPLAWRALQRLRPGDEPEDGPRDGEG